MRFKSRSQKKSRALIVLRNKVQVDRREVRRFEEEYGNLYAVLLGNHLQSINEIAPIERGTVMLDPCRASFMTCEGDPTV